MSVSKLAFSFDDAYALAMQMRKPPRSETQK